MTGVTITQELLQVSVTAEGRPAVLLSVPAAPQITVQPLGAQGPPGPGGEVFSAVAIGAVSALRVVAQGPAGVAVASPGDAGSLARIVGVTVSAAADGSDVTVRRAGLLTDPAWSWVADQPLFCGPAGVLTATPPTSTAIRQVAVALSATTILIDPSDLILME